MSISNLEATGRCEDRLPCPVVDCADWLHPGRLAFCGPAAILQLYRIGAGLRFVDLFCLPRTDSMPGLVRARPFYILSRLSYGMYLNHQWLTWPIFETLRSIPSLSGYSAIFAIFFFVTLSAASALAATLTYCMIEYPLLRLRDRLLHKKTAGNRNEAPPVYGQKPAHCGNRQAGLVLKLHFITYNAMATVTNARAVRASIGRRCL